MRENFGARATADLGKLGATADTLRQLALVKHIEVELHNWKQDGNDAPQIVDAASEIPGNICSVPPRVTPVALSRCWLHDAWPTASA